MKRKSKRSRSRRTVGVLTEDTRVRAKKLHKLPKFPGKERKELPGGNGSHEDGENKRLSFLPIRFSFFGFLDELQHLSPTLNPFAENGDVKLFLPNFPPTVFHIVFNVDRRVVP